MMIVVSIYGSKFITTICFSPYGMLNDEAEVTPPFYHAWCKNNMAKHPE